MEEEILILGVGNLLLSDEGVGIHVVRRLEEMSLPSNVEVIDGGTGGFELVRHLHNKTKVIIIDAVHGDTEPGAILRFAPHDLVLELRPTFSAHQTGIQGLLRFIQESPSPPDVVIFGIVPKETRRMSMSLSKPVQEKLSQLVSAILKEIGLTAFPEGENAFSAHC